MSEGRLAATRWQRLLDEILEWRRETLDMMVDELLRDGSPPFTVRPSAREQYDLLSAWQAAGDPRYWNDPEAQAALAQLATRFGQPAPLVREPYGGSLPNSPLQQERASYLAGRGAA